MQSQRPPFVLWACLWLVPLAPAIVFAVHDLTHLDGLLIRDVGQWLGRDFSAFWLGGKLALDGGDPYSLPLFFRWIHQSGITAAEYYMNPPHSLLVMGPLSLLPYPVALAASTSLGAILLYLAAKPIVPFDARWTLALAPAFFFSGQYGLVAAALWMWSFRPNQAGSGIAAGLLTVKPHLGILLALALIVKRRWVQIAVALAICAGLLLLAQALFGLTAQYLAEAPETQHQLLTASSDQPYFAGMVSASVALRHTRFALPGHLLVCAFTLALLWRVRRLPFEKLCFPLATATFLILPYAFGYDMVAVVIGFASLVYCRWTEMSAAERTAAAFACLSPALTFTGLVAPLLLAGLWVQVSQLSRANAASPLRPGV
jgi:hypothetical protein